MDFHLKLTNVKFLQIDGQNWNDQPHSHEDVYQISISLNGLVANLDIKEKVLIEGQSIIANPLSTHGHQFGNKRSSFMIIGFNREILNEWARDRYSIKDEIEFNKYQTISPNDLKRQMRHWLTLFLFDNENSDSFTHEVENNIFQYLTNILKGSHYSHQTNVHSTFGLLVVSDIYMNRVLEYIHTSFDEDIKIDTIAELAQLSKYQFMRSFKKLTNTTPYQYILRLRI